MLDSKVTNRYNAYMKQTESGIIVKTVDSVTGVESLIKFTTDSLFLPRDKIGKEISKDNTRPGVRKGIEANPFVKKKRRYYLSRKNPTSKTTLSNVRMCLKEIQPNIPNFQVYESKNTSVDFQNSNIVFVANSKLSQGGIVNLSIPGKLGNVYYNGNISESGVVKFKATSVIKPFTIIIGDFVINVNIRHNLTSAKDLQNLSQSYNQDHTGSVKNHESKNFKNTELNIVPPDTDIIKSDKNIQDSTKTDTGNEKAVYPNSLGKEKIGNNLSVKPGRETHTKKIERNREFLTNVSESTRKLYNQNSLSFNVKPCEKSFCLEDGKNNTFQSSAVNLPGDKLSTLGDQRSENIDSKELQSSIKCIELTGEPCIEFEDREREFSNAYEVPLDSGSLKLDKSSFSCHSIHRIKENKLLDDRDLKLARQNEIGSAYDSQYIKRQSSKSSCISMQEIKNKLSDATLSLQKICSVIESLEEVSKNTVVKETKAINQVVESCDSKTSLTVSNSKSEKYCLCNKNVKDKCNKVGNNGLENTSNTGTFKTSESENTTSEEMISFAENKLSLSDEYITKELIENTSYPTEIDRGIEKVETEKKANVKKMSSKKLILHEKRKTQSLTHLMGLTKTNDESFRSEVIVRSMVVDDLDELSQTEPPEGCMGCKFQGDGCDAELLCRDKSSTETDVVDKEPISNQIQTKPIRFNGKKKSMLATERNNQTHFDQPLDSGINFGQESLSSDPGISSYSTNSIRTIYINDGCTSSYYMTMPIQNSSFLKPKKFSNDLFSDETKPEGVSLTNLKYCTEKVSKSKFGQKIKCKFSKMKTQLRNLGAINKKELQLPENNSLSGNISLDSGDDLIDHEEKEKPKRDCNMHNDTANIRHGLELGNTTRDCEKSKMPICMGFSIKSLTQDISESVNIKNASRKSTLDRTS